MNLFHIISQKYGRPALRLVRRHERCSKKLARFTNHLTFLTRCIKNTVIPKDLRVRPPVPTKSARIIAERTSRLFLRERIRLTRMTLKSIRAEIESSTTLVRSALAEEHYNSALELFDDIYRYEFEKCKARQQDKYRKISTEGKDSSVCADTSFRVVNLSKRKLTSDESALLAKGLNFSVAPKRVPATEIVAKVESSIRSLDAETIGSVRREINAILSSAEPPKPNITPGMRKALKSLKEDESIMILPADKGRASVILDTDVYRAKMSELIESISIALSGRTRPTPLPSLPLFFAAFTRMVTSMILPTVSLNRRRSNRPGSMDYLKIHKADIPLRPIVSCVSSFAYNTSKYLADILAPLVGSNGHAVHNSASFVDFLRSETIQEHEVMVSFDVVSLFTNVPIDARMQGRT
nr:uncharacterized protein LOC129260495 [Lytechinus pictus]